jgi:hypothetical protein
MDNVMPPSFISQNYLKFQAALLLFFVHVEEDSECYLKFQAAMPIFFVRVEEDSKYDYFFKTTNSLSTTTRNKNVKKKRKKKDGGQVAIFGPLLARLLFGLLLT